MFLHLAAQCLICRTALRKADTSKVKHLFCTALYCLESSESAAMGDAGIRKGCHERKQRIDLRSGFREPSLAGLQERRERK